MTDDPPPPPPGAQHLEHDDFVRWYGSWEALTPATVGDFMAGFDRPWWVIGGWAVEAFTGVHREHGDLDISILSEDVEAFRLFLGERYTPWHVHNGWLRPYDGQLGVLDPESQLWVREHSGGPWILDVPFTLATDGKWTNKRLHEHVAPIEDVTWVADDGLRYLLPEVALMLKARGDRPKDRRDLEVAWPLLDDVARAWLLDMIDRAHPGHSWLDPVRADA